MQRIADEIENGLQIRREDRMVAPTWFQLRSIGNSTPAKLTMLIPILGFLVLFSSSTEQLFLISEKLLSIEPMEAIRVSRFNLYFLYFGLVVFAIATLLYNLLCPFTVKAFASDTAFFDSELKIMTQSRANAIVEEIRIKFREDRPMFVDGTSPHRHLNVENDLNAGNRKYWLERNSTQVYDLIQDKYRLENTKWPAARILIQAIWIVAAGIISIPTIETLIRVCRLILG